MVSLDASDMKSLISSKSDCFVLRAIQGIEDIHFRYHISNASIRILCFFLYCPALASKYTYLKPIHGGHVLSKLLKVV